jgi:hypothetical protein
LKALLENYFKLSIFFLEELLGERSIIKMLFPSFIQTYASLLAKG